jgi:hypothetical protein
MEMNSDINHHGYVNLKSNRHIAYEFKDGSIKLYLYSAVPELEKSQIVVGASFSNIQYAFFPDIPLEIGEEHLFPN